MSKKTIIMTEGNIRNILISFALPMLLGNLFSQCYSMVDTIIVGRYVGKHALAAVGATTPIILIMIAVLIGLNVGVTVVLSHYFGAKNQVMLQNAFANSIYICCGAAALMSVMGILVSRPVLILMRTPEELLNGACTYLYISFVLCIGQMFYFLFGSAFRALGDSRTPLYCLIISSVLNIVLDLVFVICFSWGIAGVAWATAISQSISAVLEYILLRKLFPVLHLRRENFKLQRGILADILKLAVPMALQNSFNSIGSVFIQMAVNGFGITVMAAYTAAVRIGEFAMQPMNTLGNTISVYVGQNYGARQIERIRSGVKIALQLALIVSFIVGGLIYLFGGSLAALFVNADVEDYAAVIKNVKQYLYVVSIPCFFTGFAFVFEFALRGLGDGAAPMVAGIVELLVKISVAYFAAFVLNSVIGMWFAWPLAYAVSGIVAMLRYRYYMKKKFASAGGIMTAGGQDMFGNRSSQLKERD